MANNFRWQRMVSALKKTSIEPYVFLIMFGYTVKLVTVQSLLHDRACRVLLNFSDSVCDNLNEKFNKDFKSEAVNSGNVVYNLLLLCSTAPAVVVAILLGPWSDRYSRKIPLLISTTGILVDTSIQAVITSFPLASPYWLMISATISGVTGGLLITFSSGYSYMSDISDERSRQTRFAILEFFTMMATPIGSFIGGQVFSAGGYLPVMIISPCSMALALFWLIFYIRETKTRPLDVTGKQMFKDIFRLDNLMESFRTCIKPRPGNLRLQLWLLFLVSCSIRLIHLGSLGIGYSYTKTVFDWEVERYSYTTTVFSLLYGFATIVVVPLLSRRLLVHEAAIGLIGIASLMSKNFLMSSSIYEGLLFFAWFAGSLHACGGIAVRSRISKLVSRTELGKVFLLLGTCEAPTPVLGTVIMTQIFSSSDKVYPGLVFMVAAILLIPAAAIFAWMMRLPSMSFAQYQEEEQAKSMKELKDVTKNVF